MGPTGVAANLLAAALGVAMGVLSGMGVGGGKLVVPLLVLGLGLRQQVAQAISLTAFVAIALAATGEHLRAGRVDLQAVRRLTPTVLAGAVAGAWVATRIDPDPLRRAYGVLLAVVAAHELWPAGKAAAAWLREVGGRLRKALFRR